MIKRSIQANAFLFAVIPTLVTALFVSLVLINRMSDERELRLKSQAHGLAEAVGFASEQNLAKNEKVQLNNKIKEIHANATLSVDKIAIYRESGQIGRASCRERV